MHIVHRRTVCANGAAHGVKGIGIGDLAGVHHLHGIRLMLDGQHPSHLGAVDLDLVRNEESYLTLASCRAFLLFPVEMSNGIKGKARVLVFDDLHPPCGHREVYGAVLLVHLVDDGDHVVDLFLGRFTAFLKGVGVTNDEVDLVFAHAKAKSQFNGVDNRRSLADQNVRLRLNVIVILVAVVDVILLHDLIDGSHLVLVEIDVDNALVVDSGVLCHSPKFEVHLVLFPNPSGIAVQKVAVSLRRLAELMVLKVQRGIVDGIQVIVNDRTLVFDNGLDEVLLDLLYAAQLRSFPLIAVVHSVVSVGIDIDSRLPMVVSPFLVKPPNRGLYNLSDIHSITSQECLPALFLCRHRPLYCVGWR